MEVARVVIQREHETDGGAFLPLRTNFYCAAEGGSAFPHSGEAKTTLPCGSWGESYTVVGNL